MRLGGGRNIHHVKRRYNRLVPQFRIEIHSAHGANIYELDGESWIYGMPATLHANIQIYRLYKMGFIAEYGVLGRVTPWAKGIISRN